ncbi:uncharacterized protein LOC128651909 isoform X1 [Bombina bombina]|uniref:uncharacterized protein LOC128651909 isoform X1 n=1 Tax=Bombina bombina TaxID=8345 RepID=UPI00235AFD44|nr:uncharacterized protein LOC128651909 isoform X1 [Bombina bombina]
MKGDSLPKGKTANLGQKVVIRGKKQASKSDGLPRPISLCEGNEQASICSLGSALMKKKGEGLIVSGPIEIPQAVSEQLHNVSKSAHFLRPCNNTENQAYRVLDERVERPEASDSHHDTEVDNGVVELDLYLDSSEDDFIPPSPNVVNTISQFNTSVRVTGDPVLKGELRNLRDRNVEVIKNLPVTNDVFLLDGNETGSRPENSQGLLMVGNDGLSGEAYGLQESWTENIRLDIEDGVPGVERFNAKGEETRVSTANNFNFGLQGMMGQSINNTCHSSVNSVQRPNRSGIGRIQGRGRQRKRYGDLRGEGFEVPSAKKGKGVSVDNRLGMSTASRGIGIWAPSGGLSHVSFLQTEKGQQLMTNTDPRATGFQNTEKVTAASQRIQSAVPQDPSTGVKIVWVMGHSFIYWANAEASKKMGGLQLGCPVDQWEVKWFGIRGMCWELFFPLFLDFGRMFPRPQVLIVHLGGNDLGMIPQKELVRRIKRDLGNIKELHPEIKIIWSQITPRLVWRSARDYDRLEKSRKKINKIISSFVKRLGGGVVFHPDFEVDGAEEFYLKDGVHFNQFGLQLFIFDIKEALGKILGLAGLGCSVSPVGGGGASSQTNMVRNMAK